MQQLLGRKGTQRHIAHTNPGQAHLIHHAILYLSRCSQPHHGIVAVAARQLVEGVAMSRGAQRHFAGHDDFVGRQFGGVQAGKEIAACNAPLALQAAGNHRAIERQQTGRPLGGRVAIGNRSAKSAQIADGAVGNVWHRQTQQRRMLCDQHAGFDLAVSHHGAYAQVMARHAQALELLDRLHVNQ